MRRLRHILAVSTGLIALSGAMVCAAPPPWDHFEIAPPRPRGPVPAAPSVPSGPRPAAPAPYSAPGPYGAPPGLISSDRAPAALPTIPVPAAAAPLPLFPARTPQAAAPERVANIPWQVVGQSQLGRPIEAVTLGQGARRVLVVGPLAGDDVAGLGMVDKLAEYAQAGARLGDLRLTIVRDPNPDGRSRRTAANGMGVLLDRNFAAANWKKLPEGGRLPSGPRPHSEAESRTLAGLLADLQPDVVVSVVSGPACGLAWAGPSDELARDLAEELALEIRPVRSLSGSWAEYVAADRGVSYLEFSVPAQRSTSQNWAACGRGLIAAAGIATPEPRKLPVADIAEPMPRPSGEVMLEWWAARPASPAPREEAVTATPQARTAAFPRRGELATPPEPLRPLDAGQDAELQPAPTDHGAPEDGWRPAGPAAGVKKFWPADRIQRLPPVDKVTPSP